MTETDNGFRGEFFFLSNFYISPVQVQYEGEVFLFQTGEHIFQGMKVGASLGSVEENLRSLRALEAAPTPAKAKYWGRSIRIDVSKWNDMSTRCMRKTLALKFAKDGELAQRLLATGDTELVEYNDWNDTIWGKSAATKEGENRLGNLLMERRTALADSAS